jgi:MFS family permease
LLITTRSTYIKAAYEFQITALVIACFTDLYSQIAAKQGGVFMLKKIRGVFYGWWMVTASFFLMLVCGGTAVYGFTAFFDPIYQEMGWSRAETALAFSMRSVEGGLVQPIIGFFVDRIGARKCIIAGIVIMASSLLLISRLSVFAQIDPALRQSHPLAHQFLRRQYLKEILFHRF